MASLPRPEGPVIPAASSALDSRLGSRPADELPISLIMSCVNAAPLRGTCIFPAKSFLEQNHTRGAVLVGHHGSTAGAQNIARRGSARAGNGPRRGYGAASSGAALSAEGRHL